MGRRASWLKDLTKPTSGAPKLGEGVALDGLVPVAGEGWRRADLINVALMEEAERYGADYVFFRAATTTEPAKAEALVYVDDGYSNDDFAKLHRRLWSWGAVPLVYRKIDSRVDLLRCAHEPDFVGPDGKVRYFAFRTLNLLAEVDAQIKQKAERSWWDDAMLRGGSLWDDPAACRQLLSAKKAAQHRLVQAIADLDRHLEKKDVLSRPLRRRLLVLSLLIAYLESREVLGQGDFAGCKRGARAFFDVLGDGPALVKLLGELELRFNGDVFTLSEEEHASILTSTQLDHFARFVAAHTERSGQMTLWSLYSFGDLPVEMISHVYQLFVKDDPGAVYTPPFLVRLMISEALSPERLDRMFDRMADQPGAQGDPIADVILDPSCGSGVFLVEAYKWLIAHWRSRHGWARPDVDTLRRLMRRLRGVDVNPGAIELTAFSLCLALCEALDVQTIKSSPRLFPKLRGSSPDALATLLGISPGAVKEMLGQPERLTKLLAGEPQVLAQLRDIPLHEWCFFSASALGLLGGDVGAVLGNPPFGSELSTPGAAASYAAYRRERDAGNTGPSLASKSHDGGDADRSGKKPPDKQVAYLFLLESMRLLRPGGVLCLLQQYNLLYNQKSMAFRRGIFERWDVREVLDFASIRGLFGQADTKVVAIVAEAQPAPPGREVLHATFRRTGRVVAQRGFDLDYYDHHWLSREQVLSDPTVWRNDLFGGGRVIDLVARLRAMRSLGDYASDRGWDCGEGWIAGKEKSHKRKTKAKASPRANGDKSKDAEDNALHIIGKPFLPSEALTADGIDKARITTVTKKPIVRPRTEDRFTPPMLLVREHMDLFCDVVASRYLTYPDQIVGFCAPPSDVAKLHDVNAWIKSQSRPLRAYVAATSAKIQKATAVTDADIRALPYPESHDLSLTPNEQIVVDDIVDYYRDFVRLGQKSAMLGPCPDDALVRFCEVYARQINLFLRGLRPLMPQRWPGAICQPFAFGDAQIDWSDAEALRVRLARTLAEGREPLILHRLVRMFDGPFIFLLKPDRLRYWLRSVALRDADETLAELRAQGF